MALLWYPPAPAAGPASMLELPPDDWALEPKMDGIRVIVWERELYTRTGVKLSAGKGAAALREMVRGLDCSLDGEWLMSQGLYYLFDLPDQAGDYDQRRIAMAELVAAHPSVRLLPSFTANFPSIYETLRGQAEGVVLKRRRSLYGRMPRASMESRDWLKRRFCWDTAADPR